MSNGPQATITTTAGRRLASRAVTTTQDGNGSSKHEIQQPPPCAGSAGSFQAGAANGNVQTVAWDDDAPPKRRNDRDPRWARSAEATPGPTVTHIDTAGGPASTRSSSRASPTLNPLVADGTALTGQHEQQTLTVKSATGGFLRPHGRGRTRSSQEKLRDHRREPEDRPRDDAQLPDLRASSAHRSRISASRT